MRFQLQISSIGYRIVDIEVAKMLQRYKHNHITIDMHDAIGVRVLDHVAGNRAELGFCTVYDFSKQLMLRQMSMRNLEYHTLCKTIPGIYVGYNNPRFASDTVVDIEKISGLPMVCLAKREFNAHTVSEQLQKKCNEFAASKHEILVSNFGMLRNMVNLVDSFAIASYINVPYGDVGFYPDLRFIPFESGVMETEFGYVQRENAARSPLANELIVNLRNTLQMHG